MVDLIWLLGKDERRTITMHVMKLTQRFENTFSNHDQRACIGARKAMYVYIYVAD